WASPQHLNIERNMEEIACLRARTTHRISRTEIAVERDPFKNGQENGPEDGSFEMRRRQGNIVSMLSLSAVGIAALMLIADYSFARQSAANTAKMASANEPVPAVTPFVEEHAHFDEKDPVGSVRSAMAALGRENAAMIVFQISPDTFDHPGRYDSEIVLDEVKKHPGKL